MVIHLMTNMDSNVIPRVFFGNTGTYNYFIFEWSEGPLPYDLGLRQNFRFKVSRLYFSAYGVRSF